MKFLTLSLLSIVSYFYANAQNIVDLPNYIQSQTAVTANKITKVRAFQYKINRKGEADSIFLWSKEFLYDNKSQLIGEQLSNQKKSLIEKKEYFYNEQDELAKSIVTNYDDKSEDHIQFTEFSYDTAKRLMFKSHYDIDTTYLQVTQSIYDDTGRLIRHLIRMDNKPKLKDSKSIGITFALSAFKARQFNISDSLVYNSENKISEIHQYAFRVEKSIDFYEYKDDRILISTIILKDNQKYLFSKTVMNKYNRILSISRFPKNTLFLQDDLKEEQLEKFLYNANGTLNTSLVYQYGKVKLMSKFFYEK